MLDTWENLYADLSLTPNGDPDGDGWSNMEEFLNYLAGEHIPRSGAGNPPLFPPPGSAYPPPCRSLIPTPTTMNFPMRGNGIPWGHSPTRHRMIRTTTGQATWTS